MAYQNVGTPRFYIDLYEWMNSVGNIDRIDHNNRITLTGNPFGLNPSEPCVVAYNAVNPEGDGVTTAPGTIRYYLNTPIDRKITSKINYHAIIGHNAASCEKTNEVNITAGSGIDLENLHFRPNMEWTGGTGIEGTYLGLHSNSSSAVRQPLVNCEITPQLWTNTSGYFHATNDGFSIMEAYPSNDNEQARDIVNMVFGMDGGDYWLNTNLTVNLNCISVGTFYDMPHSPELDLTMTIENDGYDTITSRGGSYLSNVRYTGAPMWERVDGTKVPPWTIGEPTTLGRRNGRRVWNLKFNYLNDSDLFASNYMSNTYAQEGSLDPYNDEDKDIENLGANIITNGDFTDWTGDNPDSWTVYNEDSNNYVTEVSGKCRMVAQDTTIQIRKSSIISAGVTYRVDIDIIAVASGSIRFQTGVPNSSSGNFTIFDEVGSFTHYITPSSDGYFAITRQTTVCDVTFDNVSVRPQNPSDFYYTLENDNSFHAQVLNKIGNGQRFIFQPDNTNNNPDQFAICQLDQDSLNIKQVANGVYNIALKIREVW